MRAETLGLVFGACIILLLVVLMGALLLRPTLIVTPEPTDATGIERTATTISLQHLVVGTQSALTLTPSLYATPHSAPTSKLMTSPA